MAVTPVTLTVAENLLALADKPILASTPDPDQLVAGWDASVLTGTIATATDNDASFPPRRVWDGLPGLQTFPDLASTVHTLVMETTTPIDFDFVAYLNHNFDSALVSLLELQVADDTDFTVNVRTISSIVPNAFPSNKRLIDLTLTEASAPVRYTNVNFIRALFTMTSGVPVVGQVILGRRRQLKHEPNRPWDNVDLISKLDRFESRGGVMTDSPRFLGRRQIAANLNPDASPHVQDLIDWYTDIQHGRLPFVWIDLPTTAPADFHLMKMLEPSFAYPFVSPFVREFTLLGAEQGPTFLTQDP